jgi:SNF2 family DNA or RNA helicase
VCPAVAKGVWARECRKWRPDLTPVILSGRGSFRLPAPGELIIINYDILPETFENVSNIILTLITDECHNLKGKCAKVTRFRNIARGVIKAGGRVWGLSGSPFLNRPLELWNVLNSLGLANEAFGSFPRFCRLFNATQGRFGMTWGAPSPEVPAMLRRVMLRRTRKEVFPEMKGKRRETVPVDVDKKTRDLCDEVVKLMFEAGIDFDRCVEDVAITRVGGALFNLMSAARMALATAKIPAMLKVVEEFEENDQPLLVFSAHRNPIDVLAGREGWEVITGDVSAARRTEIENEFQAGNLKGVGATIAAGGVSITLTRAHNGLFVDRLFVPPLNSQAEDRMDRFGQTELVLIRDLVANHRLDERMTEILLEKQELLDGVYGQRAS